MTALGLLTSPGAAQELSLWLDGTVSHARPPADVPGVDASTYGLFSGRVHALLDHSYVSASALLGSAVAGSDGRWLRADAAAGSGRALGEGSLRGALSGFYLHYLDPFTYDAYGLDLRPAYSRGLGGQVWTARPILTLGQWSTETLEGTLRVAGGEVTAQRQLGPVVTELSALAAGVENGTTAGTYARGGVNAAYAIGPWTARGELQLQRTPLETELGWGVSVTGALASGALLHVHGGRTVRDPLFGTQGTVSFSAGIMVRPVRWSPPEPAPVAAVEERRDRGRLVRFTIRAPGAEEVAVTGDFSGWEPVAMERTEQGWQLERVLPPGLHHFGFLVDGSWVVPPGSPGVVEDGWGRENASVVVEP